MNKKKALLIGLLIVSLLGIMAFKGIYVNLHNAYPHNLYNPVWDLADAALGCILFGFLLGYWFKGRK